MFRRLLPFVPLFALPVLYAADKGADKGIMKVSAAFEPAEAKPGQTVTLKLTVSLAEGYHTYPLKQTDEKAKFMVNKLEFPKPGAVVFVGEATDPANLGTKAEPDLGIKAMGYITDSAVYLRKAVVSPKAAAGKLTVTLPKFAVYVCDKDNCYPPKTFMPDAVLTVLDGPPVAVDAKYADEVSKATDGK